MNNVLVIGDTHIPFEREGYLDFCRDVQKTYRCNKVVHIGDVVDNHSISYHEHDPDGYSPGDEMQKTLDKLKEWYKAFPNVCVTIGNHDRLPFRKAFTHGLSREVIKTYSEIWKSPKGWMWYPDLIIDGVKYVHGTGSSSRYGYINRASGERMSVVIGHSHSNGGVGYLASKNSLIFGCNAGCGIDIDAYCYEYGKDFISRPTIGCAVVLCDGKYASFIPMEL